MTCGKKFADKTADLVKRIFGLKSCQTRFESRDYCVQYGGLGRTVRAQVNFKRSVQYGDRLIARMKGEFGNFVLKRGGLVLQNLIVDGQFFVSQTRKVPLLSLNPFQFHTEQRMEVMIAVRSGQFLHQTDLAVS